MVEYKFILLYLTKRGLRGLHASGEHVLLAISETYVF